MKRPLSKASASVSPARSEAFSILMELERDPGTHSDELLRGTRVSGLSTADRNLCTALVRGTLRWQLRLDETIRRELARPDARLDQAVRVALRLGAFQLLHMDRIPPRAAINESVNLTKMSGHTFAARMVNAVLRKIADSPKSGLPSEGSSVSELAESTAHPKWMVERWYLVYGPDAARSICEHGQSQPALAVRLDSAETEVELTEEGIELSPGGILTAARRVIAGDVTATAAFKTGRARIQEEGSQLIAELGGDVSEVPLRILDCCAAPGGKTMVLAELNSQATLTALEISPGRCEALRERVGASRFAGQIEVCQGDAAKLSEPAEFDLVLADVPCSGTGTLGRNPEIRHRLKVEDLARHHARQCAILRGALRASKRRVVYSTCSLEPEENASVVAEVLAQSEGWRQVSVAQVLSELRDEGRLEYKAAESLRGAVAEDGSLTLLPGSLGPNVASDGFFLAVLERLDRGRPIWQQ